MTIPNGVVLISEGAFSDCKSLISITIPSSVLGIGNEAFSNCASLKKITIPDSVGSIGESMFAGCTSLASITIPANVTSVGNYAFSGCTSLKSIIIPNNITSIGNYAFSGCTSLKSADIGNGVSGIGSYAFKNCSSLKEIVLSDKVTTIQKSTFEGCKSLQSLTISYALTKIEDNAFNDCPALSKIFVCGFSTNLSNVEIGAGNGALMRCGISLHNYAPATCTKGKTCKGCGAVTGKALGHKYDNKCDASCNRCKATRKITHTYKTTTTKATLAKNGAIVKKCTVCSKVASKTVIKYAKTFKLSANTFVYNNKAKTPAVTVKDSAGKVLKKGTDYTVTYANGRKNVGTYKVTIKMKGNYTGTKVLTFKINPQGVALSKVTAGVKSFTAAWTPKTAQVTGYEIQYSTAKSFSGAKKVTVISNKTKNKVVRSLKAGKKYYVRIRTYKTVGKVKFYSAWSVAKTVTPKAK